LETEASVGKSSNGDSHRMKKLPMIGFVIMRVFTPHPTLEVRYIALKIRH